MNARISYFFFFCKDFYSTDTNLLPLLFSFSICSSEPEIKIIIKKKNFPPRADAGSQGHPKSSVIVSCTWSPRNRVVISVRITLAPLTLVFGFFFFPPNYRTIISSTLRWFFRLPFPAPPPPPLRSAILLLLFFFFVFYCLVIICAVWESSICFWLSILSISNELPISHAVHLTRSFFLPRNLRHLRPRQNLRPRLQEEKERKFTGKIFNAFKKTFE